jgi:hypothetical protein
MLLSPRRASTFADLLRLGAVWLAVVLLVQGFAAMHARASGPAHQHRSESPGGLFAHRHHHDETERHHHAAGDTTVLASVAAAAEEGLDATGAALVAAFALLCLARATWAPSSARHHWRAAPGWFPRGISIEPLLKPPRPA